MRFKPFIIALVLALPAARAQAQAAPAPAKEENPIALAQAQPKGNLISFAVSPDGKSIVVCGGEEVDANKPEARRIGTLQVWDIGSRTLKASMVGHASYVYGAEWSPDGSQIASEGQDGAIVLWDVASGQLKQTLAPGSPAINDPSADDASFTTAMIERPRLLGFSPDGSQVLALSAKVEWPAQMPKNARRTSAETRSFAQPLLLAWDVQGGKLARSVRLGKPGLSPSSGSARLLPGGKSFLFTVNTLLEGKFESTRVEVHDVQSGAMTSSWTLPKAFNHTGVLSHDGTRLLALGWHGEEPLRSRAQVFEAATGKPLQVLEDAQADLQRARFSRDSRKIIAAMLDGSLAIFDTASGQRDSVLNINYSSYLGRSDITPDGKYLLSREVDSDAIDRWDLSAPPSNPFAPRPLIPAPDADAIRFASDGSLWIGWNEVNRQDDGNRTGKALQIRHVAPDGKVLDEIAIAEGHLAAQMTFSPDFSLAAARLTTEPQPGGWHAEGIGVWDIAQKKLLWRLRENIDLITALAFAPDSKALVSGSDEGLVQVWDMATGKLVRPLLTAQSDISSLQFSPDGKHLAIGTEGGTVTILAMPSGEKVDEFSSEGVVSGLAWSPDGKYLASGGTIMVERNAVGIALSVWEAESKSIVADMPIPERVFGGLAFSPDGKRLAASHSSNGSKRNDGQVSVWDLASQKLVLTLRDRSRAEHLAFSPEGKTLATTNGTSVKAWDLGAAN